MAAAIALLAAPGGAGEAGDDVRRTLAQEGRARVVVSFREPEVGASSAWDLTRRMSEIEARRRNVLAGLDEREFSLERAFLGVSAMVGTLSAEGLERLLEDAEAERVDLDALAYVQGAESVALIRADQVQALGYTGKGVVVAVIDTGVDTDHPDLADDIVGQECFCESPSGGGCCPNGAKRQSGPGAAEDEDGHGTTVAGVITGEGRAAPRGVAPDAEILAVRVFPRDGGVFSSSILSALDHLLTSRPDVKVVNMSLGLAEAFPGDCDRASAVAGAFASAISALRTRGTTVFASAGNSGFGDALAVPACVSSAVSVGAVYDANRGSVSLGCTDAATAPDQMACFSNRSDALDVLAPGAVIATAGKGGGAVQAIGTSEASPHAAATAALLLEANRGLTPDRIEAALESSGVPVTDPKSGRRFPRVDARAALDAAR